VLDTAGVVDGLVEPDDGAELAVATSSRRGAE